VLSKNVFGFIKGLPVPELWRGEIGKKNGNFAKILLGKVL
jgi:hypothetical protein